MYTPTVKSGTIYLASKKNALERMSPQPFQKGMLNLFFRVGQLSIGWFSGTITGLLVIYALEFFFQISGAYDTYPDGRFPAHGNAIVNLVIRIPLWFLGTLVVNSLLVAFTSKRSLTKTLALGTVNLFLYISAIMIGMFLPYRAMRMFDVFFSGSFMIVVLPAFLLFILSSMNPFRVAWQDSFDRRDTLVNIIGATLTGFIFTYSFLIVPFTFALR